MTTTRLTLSILPLLGLLLALSTAPRVAAAEPVDIVRQTTNTLFEIVDSNRAQFQEDIGLLRERIREVMLPHIDIIYSGRLVLGRAGRSLERQQVEEFADALSELLISQYADGLLEFKTRDQVDILPLAGDNSERMTRVRTRVGLDNGQSAPVDYVFRKDDGEWKIFDVIVEGISYVATFRNQIGEQIRQDGFDRTLERLKSGEIQVRVDD